MDLNCHQDFVLLDRGHMLEHIDGLPHQLADAWKLGQELPLPGIARVERIIAAGMGGSAIGADLVAAFLADSLEIPFVVHRDYDLPAHAVGENTLVVVSSHSGNTEEALSAFELAAARKCSVVLLTTGGKLAQEGYKAGIPVWKFTHAGQPRAAVGYSFGLLLALVKRLGLVEVQEDELEQAIEVMRTLQAKINAKVPVLKNTAKRQAGNLVGRHVTIFGSGFMVPVARRWKTQLNEVAKTFAAFEPLPEADHNTLAGICNPPEFNYKEYALFIEASSEHPRNLLRMEKSRDILMLEGIGTDTIRARGETRLAQIWSMILFGDYMAYYLALAYDTDPTPIPPIVALKEMMSD